MCTRASFLADWPSQPTRRFMTVQFCWLGLSFCSGQAPWSAEATMDEWVNPAEAYLSSPAITINVMVMVIMHLLIFMKVQICPVLLHGPTDNPKITLKMRIKINMLCKEGGMVEAFVRPYLYLLGEAFCWW